jgi:hypothetical protein
VLLPHSEREAQSPSARLFLSKLLDYFGTTFAAQPTKDVGMASDALVKLINFLVLKPWTQAILVSNRALPAALLLAFKTVGAESVSPKSAVWALVSCLLKLIVDQFGVQLVMKWSMIGELEKAAQASTHVESVTRLLKSLTFVPVYSLAQVLYLRYLKSPNAAIAAAALAELASKAKTTPAFHAHGFEGMVLEYLPSLDERTQKGQLSKSLNLLCELLMTSPDCLKVAAKTAPLHKSLPNLSHYVYSVLCSEADAIDLSVVYGELKWWLETGLREYVSIYDKACAVSFDPTVPIEAFPSIVIVDGLPLVPPHLFGRLARTDTGIQMLLPHLPVVFELCAAPDVDSRRAGFLALGQFASSPATADYVSELGIVELLIEAAFELKSFMLRGTLLAALSMVAINSRTTEVLARYNFQLFKFGPHACVVPVTPDVVLIPVRPRKVVVPEREVLPSKYAEFATMLMNPINRAGAMRELGAAQRDNRAAEMGTVENSMFVQTLLGKHTFPAEQRQLLLNLFRQVPVMAGTDTQTDPRMEAEAAARIYEAQIVSANQVTASLYVFSTIPIPKVPLADLRAKKPDAPTPEVYLSDADFLEGTGVERDAFYALAAEETAAIRGRLLGSD